MVQFPQKIRRAVYTTKVIELLNYNCGKSRKPVSLFRLKKPLINWKEGCPAHDFVVKFKTQ